MTTPVHGLAPMLMLLALVLSLVSPTETTAPPAPVAMEFETWDLWLEDVEGGLGAWQVELRDVAEVATLVGIEGGEHPAYAEPARYDPAALRGGHVVLAAFSTAAELPSRRTRVVTLHLMTNGNPDWKATLEVAVDGEGRDIPARLRLERRP